MLVDRPETEVVLDPVESHAGCSKVHDNAFNGIQEFRILVERDEFRLDAQ